MSKNLYAIIEGIGALTDALDESEVPSESLSAVLEVLVADGEIARMASIVARDYAGDFPLSDAAAAMLRALKVGTQSSGQVDLGKTEAPPLKFDPSDDLDDADDDDDGDDNEADVVAQVAVPGSLTQSSFYSGQNVNVNGSLYKGMGRVDKVSNTEDKVYVRCGDSKLRSYNSADIAAGKLTPA